MRLAAAVCAVVTACLVVVAAAAAHVTPTPSFATAGQRETISLVTPNERDEPMTGLTVTVPAGLSIVEAIPPGAGWKGVVEGATATWSGGSLAGGATSSFSLVLEASAEPGSLELEVAQLYSDGDRVPWPVVLTIVPGESSSGSRGTVLVVVGSSLLVAATIAVVVWLGRRAA